MTDSISLAGKVAVVTGAAGGLGFATASQLSRLGARLFINDLNEERCEVAAAKIEGSTPLPGNVADHGDCEAMLDKVVKNAERVDILVNNAGLLEKPIPTIKQNIQDWRRVVDVNLQGVYLMSKSFGQHMVARRAGTIVNVASVVGLSAMPASNSYGVSKAGVIMMTKTMATEWARFGVRVNAVAPGIMDAPMFKELSAASKGGSNAFERRIPMGRLGDPDELARVIAFLASDWAAYCTGITIPVDGGWHAYGGLGDASPAAAQS